MFRQGNIRWLKNRLQTMGPAEVLSRLGDVGRHMVLRTSINAGLWGIQSHLKSSSCLHMLPAHRDRLEDIDPEMQGRVIAEASRWLNHQASFFALNETPLGDSINWCRDYSSGITIPMKYSTSINHRNIAVVGNLKYVWELNRLQHLVLLAIASIWTGNTAYREEIAKQLLSWSVENPFMRTVNWTSSLEAAMRLISWAFTSFLTRGENSTEDLIHQCLGEMIYQHQYFVRHFYSKYSSANNHLIGEMAGLYVGSTFWPCYQESPSWRAFAREKLALEMTRQVEPDGVAKERTTEYQLFILEFFLLAGALGQAFGDQFPQEYWERLAGMMSFLAAVSDRQGNLPLFGDGDSGQAIWLPETTPERVQGLLRLRQFPKRSPGGTDLRTGLLLWGQGPEETPLGPACAPQQSLCAFPDGGYYVLATDRGDDDEMLVVFDAGPLGLHPLYAHGHADALSFWLSYGGHEFLIDPGTFCYHTNPRWRAYFRGTAAHNTIRVDGEDQSVAGGTFLWRHVARCHVEHVEENDAFVVVTGVHDGYRRLADPVGHRREMRLYKKVRTLSIRDHLECHGSHDVELLFHFSEKCSVRPVGPNSFEVSNHTKCLSLSFDARLRPTLYHGSENPPYGWVSRTFDVKKPSFTLVAHTNVTGSTQFLTEIAAISR